MPSALILLADGTEEMEFTITYDTLVRAGVTCTSAYVSATTTNTDGLYIAHGSRGIKIVADQIFNPEHSEAGQYNALVIPGGAKGAETMSQNPAVQALVREYIQKQKTVGMICAGSLTALTSNLPRQPLTSHPSVKNDLASSFDYSEEPVVTSGNLITSRGPGTAFPFALTLVEALCGKEKRTEVTGPMVFPPGTPF